MLRQEARRGRMEGWCSLLLLGQQIRWEAASALAGGLAGFIQGVCSFTVSWGSEEQK